MEDNQNQNCEGEGAGEAENFIIDLSEVAWAWKKNAKSNFHDFYTPFIQTHEYTFQRKHVHSCFIQFSKLLTINEKQSITYHIYIFS